MQPGKYKRRSARHPSWFPMRSLILRFYPYILLSVLAPSLSALILLPWICTAQDQPEYVPGVVVVQFVPEVAYKTGLRTGLQEFDRRAALYEVHEIERTFPFLDHVEPTPKTRQNLLALRRTYYVRYHAKDAPERVAKDLNLSWGVVYAEPVPVNRTQSAQARAVPNDPSFISQPALQWLRLPEAWDVVKGEDGSPRVVIAIVDGGGLWNHEDLLDNVWTNAGEVPDNGVDDDDNGFIDDVYGWNFCMRVVEGGCISGPDPTGRDTPNSVEHGTLVAGIAGAATDNGVGIAGAAWNADLMYVGTSSSDDKNVAFGYEGVLYSAANGADVINVSWHNKAYSSFGRDITELATDMGALIVASAGNDSKNLDDVQYYPAMYPRVLSVGSTEGSRIAYFSNYGSDIDVFAPGVMLLSTGSLNKRSYASCSGTSCSTPLVSGVAALVKTKHPDWTPDMIREHIRSTAENIDAYNPEYVGLLGRGLVNALSAVGGDSTEDAVAFVHQALKALYKSTNGGQWLNNAGWDTTRVPVSMLAFDQWHGLTIRNNRLAGIILPRNQLTGSIPAELGHLTKLTELHLNENQLTGPIPPELGNLTNLLYLSLDENQLTGPIPPELGNLTNLLHLHLDENQLTGSIPRSFLQLQRLALFDFSSNAGLCAPFDDEFQAWLGTVFFGYQGPNCQDTQKIAVVHNALKALYKSTNGGQWLNNAGWDTTRVPVSMLAFDQWQGLTVTNDPLTGSPPRLEIFNLPNNRLTGPVPPELGNLTELKTLNLNGNRLTGPIPPELGNLTGLQRLSLQQNQLTGPIPRSFLQLRELYTFRFQENTGLCAPADDEFQTWLGTIASVAGPNCPPAVSSEQQTAIPAEFTIQGNYPNPFRNATVLLIDMPYAARVGVEVYDVTGRRVYVQAPANLPAGYGSEIVLQGLGVVPGTYLYRLTVDAPEGVAVHTGRFVRVR